MDFDIPSKDELKSQLEKTLTAQAKEASTKFKEYMQSAIQSGEWPARMPVTEVPEGVRDEFEQYLKNKNYRFSKTESEYVFQKPE